MLQVVREMVCQDTVAISKWMVREALKGKLRGLAVCFRTIEGEEKFVFTGAYRSRPESAIGGAARLYWAASRKIEQKEIGRR